MGSDIYRYRKHKLVVCTQRPAPSSLDTVTTALVLKGVPSRGLTAHVSLDLDRNTHSSTDSPGVPQILRGGERKWARKLTDTER